MTTQIMWPPLDYTIPDGSTWTGTEAGGTWTSHGTSLTMEYPDSPRATLAAALQTYIGTDTGVQIYTSPPKTPVPPAIVIRPGDPYQAPYHATGDKGSAWVFEVDIIMRANRSDAALAGLERAREIICQALPAGWRWIEFGGIEETEISKKTYLKGTLDVAVAYNEGMT